MRTSETRSGRSFRISPRQLAFPELPARKVFLLLPDPGKSGSAAPVCGVIWQGNHYPEAIKAAEALQKTENLTGGPGLRTGITVSIAEP